MNKTLHGCALDQLKTLEDNSIDSIITDPPYFLTNGSGSGFMGKEWDSLSIANAFAESILRSLKPVWLTAEASSALENANISSKKNHAEKNINALFVEHSCIDPLPRLNRSTFSVLDNVLTKAEVLALSKELWSSLTTVIERQPDNVLYVLSRSFTERSPKGIAQELALSLHTEKICEEIETLHSLMADLKTNDHIEGKTGSRSDLKFINATSSYVKNVESTVLEKRYNVTTSSRIESDKTVQWITSSRYVRNAMAKFTEIPGNIQLLSERFHYNWLVETLRVLKPGAHLLAFAGTRTYHRLVRSAEDAGFEIRDQVGWCFGSGFPKSHNLKGDWEGFGTALKPAWEPICLARKPLEKGLTVAQNVLKYRTGALNIDASRVATEDKLRKLIITGEKDIMGSMKGKNVSNRKCETVDSGQGRWPANLILDEEAAALLDEQSGISPSNRRKTKANGSTSLFGSGSSAPTDSPDDSGGASRFFYVAKASKRERGEGNNHPTVKPVKLMEYLIRLVTPPGGIVLDPFMGSGTTCLAAKRLGFNYIGIERELEYFQIAEKRIESVLV